MITLMKISPMEERARRRQKEISKCVRSILFDSRRHAYNLYVVFERLNHPTFLYRENPHSYHKNITQNQHSYTFYYYEKLNSRFALEPGQRLWRWPTQKDSRNIP